MNAFCMHAISPNTALQTYDITDHTILSMFCLFLCDNPLRLCVSLMMSVLGGRRHYF